MAHVIRSPQAAIDVREIVDYISLDDPKAAFEWLRKISAVFDLIADFPLIGEAIHTPRHGELRRLSKGAYVIYFRPRSGHVEIVRVLHGARDERRLL